MVETRARRLLGVAAGGAVPLAAVVCHWVDPARCAALLLGGELTETNALAVAGGVCWLGVSVIVAIVANGLWRRATPPAARAWQRALLLAAALMVLALGVAHHAGAYRVCCAGAAGAEQIEQHVR